MLRRLWLIIGTILLTALALAVSGFWFWPASLLAFPLLGVIWHEIETGGLLDPLPYRKGLTGERQVGGLLAGLGADYHVVHDLDTGHGNIDHVVVGPTGVFAIETKNLAGRLELVHGRLTRDQFDASEIIRQARAEAMAVRHRLRTSDLDHWVDAVVAASGAVVPDHGFEIQYVKVVPATRICELITNRRVRLSPEEVTQVADLIGA